MVLDYITVCKGILFSVTKKQDSILQQIVLSLPHTDVFVRVKKLWNFATDKTYLLWNFLRARVIVSSDPGIRFELYWVSTILCLCEALVGETTTAAKVAGLSALPAWTQRRFEVVSKDYNIQLSSYIGCRSSFEASLTYLIKSFQRLLETCGCQEALMVGKMYVCV